MSAAIGQTATHAIPPPRDGANAASPLQSLLVRPVAVRIASTVLDREHYLHSTPGGTCLAFGVFLDSRLLGAVTFGAGPYLAHRLVEGACLDDCLTLTRFWLSDELPSNAESRVLGIVLRALRKHSSLRFLVTYADPTQGHPGTIYQATNWLYTGLSEAMPRYDLGDGKPRHSRSVSHAFGTHSVAYLASHGIPVTRVPQEAKHRYVYFLDQTWQPRLKVPALPYPRKGADHAGD